MKKGEEAKMKKTSIGLLVVVGLWIGVGSLAYGGSAPSENLLLGFPSWTEDGEGTAKDGGNGPQSAAADPGQRTGIRLGLEKRPWSAAFKVVALNLGVGAFDSYVMNRSWAKISLTTIRRNIETGFVFDNDTYTMNCFCHPFHGSLYFNIARSSGLSFWQSAPYALGGSAMWETCMETEPPSINDLVFTTTGGTYLGETLFRISSRIVDGRTRGLDRVGRELLGFVLNPAEGLTRLLNGQMFRYEGSSDETGTPFKTTLVIGRTESATPWRIFQSGGEPFLSMTFRSGDPFTEKADPGAFDFFVHHSRFQLGKKFSMTQSGYGYLGGLRFVNENGTGHVLGVFLDFDFRMTEAVRLAAPSITGGWISRFRLGTKAEAQTAVQVGVMLLGTCSDPYIQKGGAMERDYDYGSGLIIKGEEKLSLGKWGTFELTTAHHILFVIKGTSGVDRATFFEASYDIPVYKSLSLGLEYVYALRNSNYRRLPGVQTSSSDLRLIGAVRF
jgi:hypothetical protein